MNSTIIVSGNVACTKPLSEPKTAVSFIEAFETYFGSNKLITHVVYAMVAGHIPDCSLCVHGKVGRITHRLAFPRTTNALGWSETD